VSVLTDGGISAAIGRLKLVNPPEPQLRRGGDGLFRLAGGATAPADAAVSVVGGALEASNVNVVEEMIAMIELAREFDLHMNLLKNAEGNARQANRLLAVS
jgi:flagellar basal-body rod protein FlgF